MLELEADAPKPVAAEPPRQPKWQPRPKIPRLPGTLPVRPTQPVIEQGRYAMSRRDLIAVLAARDDEQYYAATYAIIQALSVEIERVTGMHRLDAVRVADALRRRRMYARYKVDGPNLNAIAMSALLRPRDVVTRQVRQTIRYTIARARLDMLTYFASAHPAWLTDDERELLARRAKEKSASATVDIVEAVLA